MRKLITSLILALVLVLVTVTPALAWGPIGHTYIATQVATRVVVADYNSFIAGSLFPDFYDASIQSTGKPLGSRHSMLHSDVFYNALKSLALTSKQKSFVQGWKVHLESDKVEGQYGATIVGSPYTLEYAVDKLVPRPIRSISIDPSIASLILKAWAKAYPTTTQKITLSDITIAVGVFNAYLLWLWRWMPPSAAQAIKWYPDFGVWIQKSVDQSAAAIR